MRTFPCPVVKSGVQFKLLVYASAHSRERGVHVADALVLQPFMQLVLFAACRLVASYINLPSHSINQLDTTQRQPAVRNMFMKQNNSLLSHKSREHF